MNIPNSNATQWLRMSKQQLLTALHVNPATGLTNEQVATSRTQYGSNIVTPVQPMSTGALLLEGIKEPMMMLLLSIAAISLLFKKYTEAIAMLFVVAAYITVEFINKHRTDQIMTKLRTITAPTTRVLRAGAITNIPSTDIVIGDMLIITEGTIVPADARLITAVGLLVNEAALTGESSAISKNSEDTATHLYTIFAGTTILSGEGTAIVIAVGTQTQLGMIVQTTQAIHKEQTTLQTTMTQLAKTLALIALVMSAFIPAIGLLRGLPFQEMVLTWLALTFLMIPGQPPIIITMALALAAFELAKKQIIVKRLRGAEILGQITAIVSDKTGTITQNIMHVESFILPDGTTLTPEQLNKETAEKITLAVPALSNDPTDAAVRTSLKNSATQIIQPTGYTTFSEKNPWRSLHYTAHGKTIESAAGKPEQLIAASTLSEKQKTELLQQIQEHAAQGKRVIGFGVITDTAPLEFIALAIISDPVRPEVKSALTRLHTAGVTTFLVTGDYQLTTQAIAHEIGLQGSVVTGTELATMNEQQLQKTITQSRIFARTTPTQKLQLVQALQTKGETVAVIGDGVNDAPALKKAEVGIAMGQIGTDLAKEVADLILTDDNYAHLPDAIAIGRKALDNFIKGLTYYLTAKFILLGAFLVPLALGVAFPFAPLHIILIELLMDLASSTIFVTENAEPDIMQKPMQKITEFLNLSLIGTIARNGIWLCAGILAIYLGLYYTTHNLVLAQTAALVTWLIGHILLAMNLKQKHMPLIKQGLLSNTFAVMWLGAMIFLSIAITTVPTIHTYLSTTWLPLHVVLMIIAITISTTCWIEIKKLLFR